MRFVNDGFGNRYSLVTVSSSPRAICAWPRVTWSLSVDSTSFNNWYISFSVEPRTCNNKKCNNSNILCLVYTIKIKWLWWCRRSVKAGNKVFGSSASYLNCLFFNLFTRGFTSMMFFPNPLNSKVTTRTAALLTSQALSVFSTADKQLKIYQTKPDLHHELTKNEQVTMKQGRWRVFLTRGGSQASAGGANP